MANLAGVSRGMYYLVLNPMEKALENPRINGLWLSKC